MSISDIKPGVAQPWEAFDADLDEAKVERASPALEQEIDGALGLQPISIRLQKSLLKNLKVIANHHNVGYQPLIRDLLNRFARSEMRLILGAELEKRRAELEQIEADQKPEAELTPVDEFFERERRRRA